MRNILKTLVKRALVVPGAGVPFAPLLRNRATVFMLHRFRQSDLGIAGHDPDALRSVLAHLRRERYRFMDLEELVRTMLGDGAVPRRTVAFTIDDGYAEQADVGAAVFREFDCPVTTFVTTGFLDGRLWFWWDRVEYVFRETPRRSLRLPERDGPETPLDTGAQKTAAQAAFTVWCKSVPDARKQEAIADLADRAEVELPSKPPHEYAPMSWEQLRRCEDGGMSFGPHTDTHPILTRVPDAWAWQEIKRAWARLRQEARQPVPIFCYPNGQPGDYGVREVDLLRQAGLLAAVCGSPGYVDQRKLRRTPRAAFELPRINYDSDLGTVVQYASGMGRFMDFLRGEPS